MTRLSVAHTVPRKPVSAALSELAIAAGAAGHSITLCFCDFPAPVLCELWKYCMRYAGLEQVLHVETPRDVRWLAGHAYQVRLALLYNPRFRNAAAWAVQMTPDIQGAENARSALFCWGGTDDFEEDPGATLLLRGSPGEQLALSQWLSLPQPNTPDWREIRLRGNVQMDPTLESGFSNDRFSRAGLHRLRDRHVLQGLVFGAAVVRTLEHDGLAAAGLVANLDDYELIRPLLQSPIVASADEGYDPLAADMIRRANVFLAVKHRPGDGNTLDDVDQRTSRELITRREVSDLGNVRSGMVRRLVEFLKRQPDGHELFRRMGLLRHAPEPDAWRQADVNELVRDLRPWSYKQVRAHFDRLQKAGMIVAERDRANGPWQYRLPEELTIGSRTFRRLPSAREIGGDN